MKINLDERHCNPGGYAGENIKGWDIFKTIIFLIFISVLGFVSFLWLEIKRRVRRIR